MANERDRVTQKENSGPVNAEKSAAQARTPSRPESYYPPNRLSVFGSGSSDEIPLTRDNLLFLQRAVGNRAVAQLLQKNGKLSRPGDVYERADGRLKDGERLQLARTQLSISQPNDSDEIEADEVADRIMRMPHSSSNGIRRETSGVLGEHPGPPIDQIDRLGPGHPMDRSTQEFFEPRLGTDLSDVRLHTDRAAADSATSYQARAYTLGSHIVFASGEYAPDSHGGRRLLAHELTHTVQQRSGAANSRVSATRIARQSTGSSQSNAPASDAASDAVRHALNSGKSREVMNLDDAALAGTTPAQRAGLVKILTDQLWTSKADEQATMKLIRLKGEHASVLAQIDVLGYRQKLLDSVDDDALHTELQGLFAAAPVAGTGPVAGALSSRKSEDVQKIPYADLKSANRRQRVALLQIMLELWSSNAAEEGRILDILETSGGDLSAVIADVKALGLKQKLFDHIDEEGAKQRLTTLLKSLGDPELDADLVVFNRSFFGNVGEGLNKGLSSAWKNFSIGGLVMGMLQPIIHPIDTISKHIDDAIQVIKTPSVDGVIALLRDIFGTLGIWLLVAAGVVALVGLAVSAGIITLPAGIAIEGVAGALLTAATWCGIAFIVLTIIKLLLDTGEAGAATTAQEHETESHEIGEGITTLAVIGILALLLRGLGKFVERFRGAAEDPAKAEPGELKDQAKDAKDSQGKATDEANKLKDAADKKQGAVREKPAFKKGAYEAADPAKTPKEWEFQDKVEQKGDQKIAETRFKAPSPKEGAPRPEGMGRRALNTKTGALELQEINVPRDAGWIKTETPMVEGMGTRTASYITMRLMRMLGITAGSLKSVVIRNIYNLRAVLELRALEKQGIPRERAVLETNSVTSQENALTQSGHKVAGAKVTGGKLATLKELLNYWETRQETLKSPAPEIVKAHDKVLNDFGLTREQATSQQFFWDYDIELTLDAAEGGAQAAKGIGAPLIVPALPKYDDEDEVGN